jgi:hypothetical protein
MAEVLAPILRLNAGLLSGLALARTDLKRYGVSAEQMTNFMPRMAGSMMLRPGLGYIATTRQSARAKYIPFIFSSTDTALIELTDGYMRVLVGDVPVSRVAVSTAIVNGSFATDISGWTDADETAATSQWIVGGLMELVGNGFNSAKRTQTVSVAAADQGKEHGLRIFVSAGPVTIRVGSSGVRDDLIAEHVLGAGWHSLAFTPGASFVIQLSNASATPARVKSVAIEAAGVMELPTPWTAAMLYPKTTLRWDQSGDIVYVACDGLQQRKIMRSLGSDSLTSWAIETYQPLDGPFRAQNAGSVTLTPSDILGAITLMASEPFFYTGHAGALFRVASFDGQKARVVSAGLHQYSAPVKVTGIGAARTVSISISGTWVGTVEIERSVGAIGDWQQVAGSTWTANATTTMADGLDNQIIFYRIGFDAYTSGAATCEISVSSGSLDGIVRIDSVTDATHAAATVLTRNNDTGVLQGLGGTGPTDNWWESEWSDHRGWPTAVALHEGRLWWAGRDAIIGSESDAYEDFNDLVEGDAGPIIRTIGSGPVDTINWLLPLQRLLIGAQGAEKSARSSSFDSPLTPTDFLLKDASTQGSADIAGLKIDFNGVFVQKSGRRVYLLAYQPSYFMMDYTAKDLTNFVPDIAISEGGVALAQPGFIAIAVQRQPDTRIHALLADGTARVLIFDPAEEEQAWVKVETPGAAGRIVDVVVLPGEVEDVVYYEVERVVGGLTVHYLEKWAHEEECWGASMSKLADSHVAVSGAPSATIALPHLVGETVVAWGDGVDRGTFVVPAGGNITLGAACSSRCAGLPYTARFKSTKLAYGAQLGTALAQRKRVPRIGLICANTHWQGLRFGPNFDRMDNLPSVVRGKAVAADTVHLQLDDLTVPMPAQWDSDTRLCLQAAAPRPVTVLGVVLDAETRERV